MAKGKLTVQTEKILPIIKRWLYSDKEIFLRELISNSCDALKKLQILREEQKLDISDEELRIELKIDPAARTLQFIDSGIGMSSEEVERYIGQIACSGAEEFLSKYSGSSSEAIIGHFGLGFYSAYMVAEKVTIDTLSYLPGSEAAFWSCDGSSDYLLEPGSQSERGTKITLFIDANHGEFLDKQKIEEILKKHCRFLPYPIYLDGTRINEKEPLWLKNSADCSPQEYIDFYRFLYPSDPDPIFWIHLNVDLPFFLKGILYFPKINQRIGWNNSNIQLFVNRVFVSDHCNELLPDFLTALKGAIESPDIPINVSRSSLQMDQTVRTVASHISKKVCDKLISLYQIDREQFIEKWPDLELIIKLGILQDEKFYSRAKEILIWKSNQGKWESLDELIARNPAKLFYSSDPDSPLIALYKEQPVLISSSPIDPHLFNFLESKLSIQFQRVDGALDPSLVDPSREKSLLDSEGRSESGRIAEMFRRAVPTEVEVEAKSLASEELPALLLFDESSRRLRDAMSLTQKKLPQTFKPTTQFIVNTNHPLISTLFQLSSSHPPLAQEVASHLYQLSHLSQKEIDNSHLPQFVNSSTQLLKKLLDSIAVAP